MIENILNSIKGTVKLHCQFTFSVPGFSELDHDDQQILLKERWAEHWLVRTILHTVEAIMDEELH